MEQPIVNGAFQFLNAVKSTASNHPFRNQAKESFDLVEPRTAGRCEVKVEPATFLGFEPTLDKTQETLPVPLSLHTDQQFLAQPSRTILWLDYGTDDSTRYFSQR